MYKLYIYFNCPIVILYMFDSKREGDSLPGAPGA